MNDGKRIVPGPLQGAGGCAGTDKISGEIQYWIRCRDRSAEEVLGDLANALAQAGAESRDPLIVFEDLGLLGDSVATLIKGISRRLVGYPRTVTFWECSGYTEAFLSAMEGDRE